MKRIIHLTFLLLTVTFFSCLKTYVCTDIAGNTTGYVKARTKKQAEKVAKHSCGENTTLTRID